MSQVYKFGVRAGAVQLRVSIRVDVVIEVIDDSRIARRSVGALSEILKEDPHKHSADCQANRCQAVCRMGFAGDADCRILCLSYVRCYHKLLRNTLHPRRIE